MEIAKYVIVAYATFIIVTDAAPEYFRVVGHAGNAMTAYEDVMIDEDTRLVVATVAHISVSKIRPTIAFHDFAEGFSAIKDVQRGVCHIEKSQHTFEYLRDLVYEAERVNGNYEITRTFKCKSQQFVEESELIMYGERIAAFCKNYKSYFVEKEYKIRNKRGMTYYAEADSTCLVCWGRACSDSLIMDA